MSTIFTPANTEAAAILGGDPHRIHYQQNELGFHLVGGIYQMMAALAQIGWLEGFQVELNFRAPMNQPTKAGFYINGNRFEFSESGKKPITEGMISQIKQWQTEPVWKHSCTYVVTDNVSDQAHLKANWDKMREVSPRALLAVLPPQNYSDASLAALSSVNLMANALGMYLKSHPEVLPTVSYQGVREEGTESVLERKLSVRMEGPLQSFREFTIYAAGPMAVTGRDKDVILAVQAETPFGNLYSAQMQLVRMPNRVFNRHGHSTNKANL